jgi:triphosphatase
MAEELEFKLAIAPAAAADFWAKLRAHFPDASPARHTLFSAYYDTPKCHLQREGIALRLRRERGKWLQTIKRGGETAGGLHRRVEHEVEVAAQLPSFPAMEQAGIGEVVANIREDLGVVFVTEFERASAQLHPDADTTIEVALDRGAVIAGNRRDPICEVELELKAGQPQALFDLARRLAQALPLRLDDRSKAERGYRLAASFRAAPVKAADSAIDADMPVGVALRRLAFQCLSQLQANEAGVLAGRNPEYLHQARVALRRLRSLLRLFQVPALEAALAPLLERLRTLAGVLGEARNLDVFLGETLAAAGNATHPGMAVLRQRAQLARRHAARAAREAMSAPAYTLLMLDLLALLSNVDALAAQPLGEFAAEQLARHLRKAKKRARHLDALEYAELHRLRIALKRQRYAMEFFAPLWPGRMAEGLEALSALQDRLGHINDCATAWKLLDALAVQSLDPGFQQAVGFVRGWTAQAAEHERDGLGGAWKDFARWKPAWR